MKYLMSGRAQPKVNYIHFFFLQTEPEQLTSERFFLDFHWLEYV